MIGSYELVRCVGRGGMGSVWEARHASLGTPVAIKFVEGDFDDDARRRFENEARAAAALRSSHVIRVFDHGVSDEGKPYIVMELLTGESLEARLSRVGRLTIAETALVIGQTCRALEKAHAEGIVHRDIKPENLFLARDEEGVETVKVLDFGVAKITKREWDGTASTRSGTILGTPFYMSPEQGRGLKETDARSDLWSLGVIAYECVVGRLPFDAATLGALLVEICTAPIPVPSRARADVPKAFDGFFARACARDPNERFSNATDLAKSLSAIGDAAGVATTQPMPVAHRPRSSSKRLVVALAATFGVTFGALALVHTLAQPRRPTVLASAGIVSAVAPDIAPPMLTNEDTTIATLTAVASASASASASAVAPRPLKPARTERVSGPGF